MCLEIIKTHDRGFEFIVPGQFFCRSVDSNETVTSVFTKIFNSSQRGRVVEIMTISIRKKN